MRGSGLGTSSTRSPATVPGPGRNTSPAGAVAGVLRDFTKRYGIFAPQGHFRRAAEMGYEISGCTATYITRLRGEMVGIVSHPLGLQDSGGLAGPGAWARFRRKISGDGSRTW